MATETEKKELTPEQAKELREKTKARIAQILGQGRANARMEEIMKSVPSDRRGCFVRERPEDIQAYRDLGYEVETGLKIEGLHGSGDGRIRVGDVILMTISLERWEIIQEVEREMLRKKLDLEKDQYMQTAQQNVKVGIVPFKGVENI